MPRQTLSQRLQRVWLDRRFYAFALLPLAALYSVVLRMRGWLVHTGRLSPQALPVPVVVVGNLIAGGAGKTPVVMAVVALLQRHGYRVAVVSRGHGGRQGGVVEVTATTPAALCGDEPRLLCSRLGVPVVVGRDRVAAAREALRLQPDVDIIVSDDGLQHRRLPRIAQIIVFDERGAGNGWLLPAGPLREPLPRTLPDKTIVLYNAASPSTALPGYLAQRSLRIPLLLQDWSVGKAETPQAMAALRGRRVLAAAGVAHPDRFFDMLRGCGLDIAPLPLPDHYDFSALPWPPGTRDVIVTEKDAVKLDVARLGATRVWVAPLDLRPGADFDAALLRLLPPPATRTPDGHATA